MQVENVYQDSEGKWHIDYNLSNLMGLAIRVYFGQVLFALVLFVPLMIISVLIGIAVGKSLPENSDTYKDLNCHNESVCIEPSP